MRILFFCLALTTSGVLCGQSRVFPVVKNFGGVFEVPDAVEKPRADLEYKVVIEIETSTSRTEDLNYFLNRVARLVNLHVMGGVPRENLHVVAVIHGEGVRVLLDDTAYKKKFKTENPNGPIIRELDQAGVKLVVCGQSLLARGIDPKLVIPEVKLATSMLTTLTTYQMMGYAVLNFSEIPK